MQTNVTGYPEGNDFTGDFSVVGKMYIVPVGELDSPGSE